jgi:hypothetical protein
MRGEGDLLDRASGCAQAWLAGGKGGRDSCYGHGSRLHWGVLPRQDMHTA